MTFEKKILLVKIFRFKNFNTLRKSKGFNKLGEIG